MENFDFRGFYDSQHDYVSFRNDEGKRSEYNVAVDWKVRNLCSLVPVSLSFKNVTEVGCAMGILLNKIGDMLSISDRTGIDIASENIKLASELFPECVFFRGILEEYLETENFVNRKGKIDLVILSDIVEHIPDDTGFLKQVSKVSNYVLLNLPLEKCFRNRKRNYGTNDPSGHLRNYNAKDASELVRSAGFTLINSFTDNAHFNKEFFAIFRKNRNDRIRSKSLLKRIFWMKYYFFEEIIRIISPRLYTRTYGSNYFALLKSEPL
jgi:hypothetical protein